jgi:hypothetical protein
MDQFHGQHLLHGFRVGGGVQDTATTNRGWHFHRPLPPRR